MIAALDPPRFPPDGAPLSVLVDFDGTISLEDVGDALLARFAPDQAAVAEMDRLYHEGEVGSRDLMRWDMDVLPADAGLLIRAATEIGLDGSFRELVTVVEDVGGAVEVVSDGLGFHIGPLLDTIGLGRIAVATNLAVPGRGGEAVAFPYGHPACSVCGTCKRERVRAHRNAGRAVVFVGDGASDRYAAHHADVVFAKGALAAYCEGAHLPFVGWRQLGDVASWVRAALADGRLPASRAGFEAWAGERRSEPERFICGPEAPRAGRLGLALIGADAPDEDRPTRALPQP
jgi:2,3-diketo-5-methylthio-1-phosphopentane phosphatase